MRSLLGLVCVAMVSLSLLGAGEKPPDKAPPKPSVEKLIEQLGDPDYRKRDAAAKSLQELGPAALPALRKALNHPDPEVRRRLSDMVPDLETIAVLTPKMVTLKVDKKTAKDILEELQRQTGYKLLNWGGDNGQVYSLDLDRMPFWQAMDKVCETCSLVIQQGWGDDQLRFQYQEAFTPYVCYDGSFRMVPSSFQYYRNINLGVLPKNSTTNTRSETLTFQFTVFAEPKLPLLAVGQPVISSAYDENKNSMSLATDGSQPPNGVALSRHGNGYRMYSTQASVQLQRPNDKSHTLKYIKGTVPVSLLTEQKAEVVTDNLFKAKGKTFKVGHTTFSIEDVVENPGPQYQVKMTVTNEDAKDTPNDYSWQNSLYQRIEVQDDKGNKYTNNGSNWGGSGAGMVQMTLTYVPPGNIKSEKPAKLVFQEWSMMTHQITFEFKDLPLP